MFFTAGTAVLVLNLLRKRWRAFAAKKAIQFAAGAAVITALELCTGMLFNRGKHMWDYSNRPFNFKGQICLLFALLWGALSLPAVKLCSAVCSNKRDDNPM